jgi:hypothetical protein
MIKIIIYGMSICFLIYVCTFTLYSNYYYQKNNDFTNNKDVVSKVIKEWNYEICKNHSITGLIIDEFNNSKYNIDISEIIWQLKFLDEHKHDVIITDSDNDTITYSKKIFDDTRRINVIVSTNYNINYCGINSTVTFKELYQYKRRYTATTSEIDYAIYNNDNSKINFYENGPNNIRQISINDTDNVFINLIKIHKNMFVVYPGLGSCKVIKEELLTNKIHIVMILEYPDVVTSEELGEIKITEIYIMQTSNLVGLQCYDKIN